MNKLVNSELSVKVPGKLILIGEHSVVYQHPAIAMPLNNVSLTLTIKPEEKTTWGEAWLINMQNNDLILPEHFRKRLTHSLTLAFELCGKNIQDYIPQSLFIHSQIPIGGGMGGSAAVSASLIKLCDKIFELNLTLNEQIAFANQIDSLFHSGLASGLDVSTILSQKLIQFQKNLPLESLHTSCHFFIALVDSTERAETSVMVQKVAAALKAQNKIVQNALENLGKLATECAHYLKVGNLQQFAENLNLAHLFLNEIGVSTPILNCLCEKLKEQGALCAKLTGAGGGGLVLAIFKENPQFLFKIYGKNRVFIDQV